jgi:hypothetical protein
MCCRNYERDNCKDVISYLLSTEFDAFRDMAASHICTSGLWPLVEDILKKNLVSSEEAPVTSAVDAVLRSNLLVTDYNTLSKLYGFSTSGAGKTVADSALRKLYTALGTASICPKGCNQRHLDGQRVPYKGKTKDCLALVPNIEALISWHIDHFPADINKVVDHYFFLKQPECANYLARFLKLGLDPNHRIGYLDMNFDHSESTLLMAAAGHGNL